MTKTGFDIKISKKTISFALALILFFLVGTSGAGYTVFSSSNYSLNASSVDLMIGETYQLQINGLTPDCVVTWGCLDSSIASISNGLITGLKAGSVIVYAYITDSSSSSLLPAGVNVTIQDGIYTLRNCNSSMYLELYDQCILENTDVVQMYYHGSNLPEIYQISQYWRIKHIGSGLYTIRPYQRLNCVLSNENGFAKIKLCYLDSLSFVPDSMKWRIIETTSNSYKITNSTSGSTYTLKIENDSTSFNAKCIAVSGALSSSSEWTLYRITDSPNGILLYDADTGLTFSNKIVNLINRNSYYSLSDLGIISLKYSYSVNAYNISSAYWESTDSDVATIESSGSVLAKDAGTSEMRARYESTSTDYTKFTALVERLPNPDLQNKDHWCWAASAKVVGVHNGGNTTSNNPLPDGAIILAYVDGLHSYRIDNEHSVICYGQYYNGLKTADAGQYALVDQIKGTDQDLNGTDTDIMTALQLASYNTMNIEKKEKNWLLGWTSALKNTFNNELSNGRYVLVQMIVTLDDETYGHSLVVKSIDLSGNEPQYTLWDPWNGRTDDFPESDFFSANPISFNNMDMTLKGFFVCN